MGSIRLNISLRDEVFSLLKDETRPRERSKFITEAILRLLYEERKKRLAREYEEAFEETKRINRELEGTLLDGLD